MTVRVILVTAFGVCFFGALAWYALHAAVCNWRRFLAVRRRPPLDGVDAESSLRARAVVSVPWRWPSSSDIRSGTEAEAYARLAEERAATFAMAGELLVLFAGAMLGALMPMALRREWAAWLLATPFLVGSLGVILRRRAAQVYEPLIPNYRARALALDRTPGLGRRWTRRRAKPLTTGRRSSRALR
jgi:hypothetical protein